MNEFDEERADILGQNGNDGPHYSAETFTSQHDEALWAYRMGNISIEEYYRRADALLDGGE